MESRDYLNLSKSELTSLSTRLKPILQIGKTGVSDNFLSEIKKHLKKTKLIKIKCLRYYLDSIEDDYSTKLKVRSVAQNISEKMDCEIIDVRGLTFTLYNGNKTK